MAEAVADCTLVVGTTAVSGRELLHPLKRLEHGARLIRKRLASGPVALLFGSEKFGLSNEDLAHCHWLMRIPSREEHSSMNLGQAVAVCLYELVREPRAARATPEKRRPAAAEVVENFTASAPGSAGTERLRARPRRGFHRDEGAPPGAPPGPLRPRRRDLARHPEADPLAAGFGPRHLVAGSSLGVYSPNRLLHESRTGGTACPTSPSGTGDHT